MNNVIISIEAVGSGMNLLDIQISNELTIKELYERIQELEIDDDFNFLRNMIMIINYYF